MTSPRSADSTRGLVRELCKLPCETEWVEFKENDVEAQRIGEYLSGLSNAATLIGKATAFVVSDVEDPSVGTRSRAYLPYWAAAKLRDPGVVV